MTGTALGYGVSGRVNGDDNGVGIGTAGHMAGNDKIGKCG